MIHYFIFHTVSGLYGSAERIWGMIHYFIFRTVSGLYGSADCICGMNVTQLVLLPDSACDVDCGALNPTAKCGGNTAMAVYRAGDLSIDFYGLIKDMHVYT
jgi:hypothetical protein